MFGDATQYVSNTISDARPLSTPKLNTLSVRTLPMSKKYKNAKTKFRGKSHCLSARDPTIVPNNIEEPKPAMKRCPISPFPNPYVV